MTMIRPAAKSHARVAGSPWAPSKPLFTFLLSKLLPSLFAFALLAATAFGQSASSPTPYASMNRDDVAYRGPDRVNARDLSGEVTMIGILLPLRGSRAAQGTALRTGAQMAREDELASTNGETTRRLTLVFRDESEGWGQASSEMVELIERQQAIALITPADGNIAHQAEQIANKIAIPILTLSSDATITRINIPWVFRLGPSDADQAQLIATDIYRRRGLRKVLLIKEDDHDGRVGAEEFLRAANLLHATAPERVDFNPATSGSASLADELKSERPDAIVLWVSPEAAATLLPALHQAAPSAVTYLSSKAAQVLAQSSQTWFSASVVSSTTDRALNFTERYRQRTGHDPTGAAREIYDAVRLLAAAVRTAGPNRARVRDYLASGTTFFGVSGAVSFDKAGNSKSEFVLHGATGPSVQPAFQSRASGFHTICELSNKPW
jgi:branched-chain amino acid transport system substrate-binding protein